MINKKSTIKKSVCPLDCPDSCGIRVTIEDGMVTALSGDRDHPYSRGVICRKMKSYPERLNSPDRILFPLLRTGRKGEGSFRRISWDEAYGILGEKISSIRRQYGGEAILPFAYAGNMGVMNRFAGYPLFHKLGTSRLEETICSTAAKAGWKSHCGDIPGSPPEIAEEAELVIIWGGNTKVTNMHFWPYVAGARKKGARLVVVDPYKTLTAGSADLHIKVEPGGDTALVLALLKKLLDNGGLNRTFIEEATTGFDILEDYLHRSSLSDFVKKSGVNEAQIDELAALLKSSDRTFLRIGIGMTRNSRAGMGIRALTSLAAALGLFDGGEGRGVLLTSSAFSGDQSMLTWPSLAEQPGRLFNMVQLGNSLHCKEPGIKMFFVYNANPLSSVPDSSLVRQALLREDLFTVVHEQVMTPTAKYADLVLPATTFLENKDLYTAYGHFYLSLVDAAIPPMGEAKSNFTFFQELAERLGFTDPPFQQTLDERLSGYLATLEGLPDSVKSKGLAYGTAVRSKRWRKNQAAFSQEKGRYSFVDSSDPALPPTLCLLDGAEFDSADLAVRYPFKLITPPHPDLLNSTFGERYQGDPGTVLIHPSDALQIGVENDELLTLFNDRGWARRRAMISDDVRQGLLVAEGLFWQCEAHPAAINDLASQKTTDMGGGGTFHESKVAILKSR
ncbi:MAG: molybdopterin-dependent oxidoreductase [Desulfopila sp.]|jgi:anaerobic selenocysteine-containing dehydrogenase|nr:molybdopterin-dependent oxidoreductase [Desulfopila sp.]